MVPTSLERTFAHIFPVHYQPTSWTLEGAVNPRDKFPVSALLSSQRDVWSNFFFWVLFGGASYQMLCKASGWLLFLRVKKMVRETILVVLEHFGSARSPPWLMTSALVFCLSRFVSNIEPFTLYYNSMFNFWNSKNLISNFFPYISQDRAAQEVLVTLQSSK